MLDPAPPFCYLIDRRRLWVLDGLALVMLIPPLLLLVSGTGSEYRQAGLVLLMVVLPFAVLLFFLARRCRLLISPRGLELVNPGACAEACWDDIEAIHLSDAMTGVILKQPLQVWQTAGRRRVPTLSLAGSPLYSPAQQRLVEQGRFIDLKPFKRQLRSSGFMRQLTQLAPQVAARTSCES